MSIPPARPDGEHPPGGSLNEYQLRLPGFEGPLDVLLRLIEREQLPIADLSLVQVTDQFLSAMRRLGPEAPPALLADFAAVGTRLALLKSRSLLPRPPAVDAEPEPGDLVQQLLRYREIRDAARHLAGRDVVDHGVFPPSVRSLPGGTTPLIRLAEYAPDVLARAIRRRLTQLAGPTRVFPVARVLSLRELVVRFASQLSGSRGVRFSALSATCQDRLEIQTAFLAGLVLMRRGLAEADQPELFGEITFRRVAGTDDEYLSGLSGDVTGDFEPVLGAVERDGGRDGMAAE